jgi:hypothetical protein
MLPFLTAFHADKDDAQFLDEKRLLINTLTALEKPIEPEGYVSSSSSSSTSSSESSSSNASPAAAIALVSAASEHSTSKSASASDPVTDQV